MSHLSSLNVHYKFSLCRSFYEIKYVAQRDTLGFPWSPSDVARIRGGSPLGFLGREEWPPPSYILPYRDAFHPCPSSMPPGSVSIDLAELCSLLLCCMQVMFATAVVSPSPPHDPLSLSPFLNVCRQHQLNQQQHQTRWQAVKTLNRPN